MVVRGAAAYSPFHRSKTHLVYTTDDLRIGFVDRIHFFGRAHPENRAYALPIGKVGLVRSLGVERLEAAAARAIEIGALSYGSVRSFLDHKLDRQAAHQRPETHRQTRSPAASSRRSVSA